MRLPPAALARVEDTAPSARAPPTLDADAAMLPPSSDNDDPLTGPHVVTQAQLKRERLRFTNFTFTRTPAGLCTAEVELEWLDGVRVVGKASGQSSPVSDLRVAAEATIKAIEAFSEGALDLDLLGVKALRAFDANIVIVSVEVKRGDGPARLLGSHLAEHDPVRSSVVAVLNATNRVLGNFIATR